MQNKEWPRLACLVFRLQSLGTSDVELTSKLTSDVEMTFRGK